MTLRKAYVGTLALIALLAFAALAGSVRFAQADSLAEEVLCGIGSVGPAHFCDTENTPETPVPPPADPCTIFDSMGNLPPHCNHDGDNGGGNGGDNGGGTPTCDSGSHAEGDACVPDDDGGSSGSGGSGGSTDESPSAGGGRSGGIPPYATGSVLGTTTEATTTPMQDNETEEPKVCEPYLTTFIRSGQVNDADQVRRLQQILNDFEGADIGVTGEYDAQSIAAVKAFQLKYAADVLTPWHISQPTGYVFLTTRKKLNEVYCRGAEAFPLTQDEKAHITEVVQASAPRPAAKPAAAPMKPEKPAETAPAPTETEATSTPHEEAPVTGNAISNFFRRIFDRFR